MGKKFFKITTFIPSPLLFTLGFLALFTIGGLLRNIGLKPNLFSDLRRVLPIKLYSLILIYY